MSTTGSNRCMTGKYTVCINAVCCACDPEPTSRFTSGLGSASSSKNTCDMLAS